MNVTRVHEDPRVTKPYTDEQWQAINDFGREIDERLQVGDVRLTMGGEPTFVSIDDMEGDEWRTAAVGPHKRRLAGDLLMRLKHRWAPGGLLHFGAREVVSGRAVAAVGIALLLAARWRTDLAR